MPDIEGGCLCTAVRYRVRGAPLSASVCHCRTCRLATGAAAVAWVEFERASFEVVTGAPRVLQSSPQVRRTFCERCGTALSYENGRTPDRIELTTASLDEPAKFPPTHEVWLEHRIAWQPLDARLEHYPQGSGL